jgi:DNA topoisomerase-6 subunit B
MPPHPHGLDVESFRALINESRKETTITQLLNRKLQRVGKETAAVIADKAGVSASKPVKAMSTSEIGAVISVLRGEKFMRPDTDCLSQVPADDIASVVKKLYEPDWIEGIDRKPTVYGGFPFSVSAVIAYGGTKIPVGLNLIRVANKVPLLYDAGSDVSQKIIDDLDWRRYKVDISVDRVLIVVSLVSVKIPYKTAGKEYIADVDEVQDEIKLSLMNLGRELMLHISARHKSEAQAKRTEIYDKYIPQALKFISETADKPMPKVKNQ